MKDFDNMIKRRKTMKPEFSFNYGEKRCAFSAENNAVYEIDGTNCFALEIKF